MIRRDVCSNERHWLDCFADIRRLVQDARHQYSVNGIAAFIALKRITLDAIITRMAIAAAFS
jgi:hypothetical protein